MTWMAQNIFFFRDSKARQEKCSPFGRMCSFHVSFGGEIIVKSLCGFVFIIFVLTNAFTKKFQLFFSRYTRKIEVKTVMKQMVSMTLFHTKIYECFPISEFNTWFCALCEVYSGEKHLQRMSLSGAGILLCSFACINCMAPAKNS